MFDTTYNIPMIIKDPNSDRVNQEDDNLVYLHDLTSTVFDLANQKCQKVLKGRAFFRLCANTKITKEKVYLVSLRGILCILNSVCGVVKITNSYLMRLMFANFTTSVTIQKKCIIYSMIHNITASKRDVRRNACRDETSE